MTIASEQNEDIAEINMTPFVDIVLVILVIFMTTATFVSQGKIPLNLPHAHATEQNKDAHKPITISLTKEGLFYLNDVAIRYEEIESTIAHLEQSVNTIILRSDAQTPFEVVVKIIDLCKKYHISSFAIQTAPITK